MLEGNGPTHQSSHIISRANLASNSQSQNPLPNQSLSGPVPPSASATTNVPSNTNPNHTMLPPAPHDRLPPSISLPAPASIPPPSSSRRDLAALFGVEAGTTDALNNRSIFRAARSNASQIDQPPTRPTVSNLQCNVSNNPRNSVPHLQSVPALLSRSVPRGHAPLLQATSPPFADPPLLPLLSHSHRPARQSRVAARPLSVQHQLSALPREQSHHRHSHLSRLPSIVPPEVAAANMRHHGMDVGLPASSETERDPRRETNPFLNNPHTVSEVEVAVAPPGLAYSNAIPRASAAADVERLNSAILSQASFRRGMSFSVDIEISNQPSANVRPNGEREGTANNGSSEGTVAERLRSLGMPQLLPSAGAASRRATVPADNIRTVLVDDENELGDAILPRGWMQNPRENRLASRIATGSARRSLLDDSNDVFMPESISEDYLNAINAFRMRGRGRGRVAHSVRGMPPRLRSGLRMMHVPRTPTESMLRRSEVRAMVAGREFGVPCGLFEYSVRGRPSLTPRIEWPEVVLISDENVKPRAPVLELMSESNVQWCVRVGPLGNGEGDGRRGYLAFIHGLIEGGFAIEIYTQGGCIYFWALSFPPYGECLLGVFRPTTAS